MTKKPLIKRSGAKRKKKDFFVFRLAAVAILVGIFSVLGLIVKDSIAQSWSEPTNNPPLMPGVSAPIWNQTLTVQSGSFWVSGKERIDTNGTANSTCTDAKV
jgi:hypothetical protein